MPEIAARAHVEALDRDHRQGDGRGRRELADLDGVAAAAGPGLIGGVIVGLTTAKAIALVSEKPLIAVNHLEAHALTARLTDDVAFPYCLFLASGGHTQILAVQGVGDYAARHHASTTRSAKPSTRPRSCSGSAIRAGRRSRRKRVARRSGALRAAAADARPADAGFLVLGPEDRAASRGREDRAAAATRTCAICAPRSSRRWST